MTLGSGWIGIMLLTVRACDLLDPAVGCARCTAAVADSSVTGAAP